MTTNTTQLIKGFWTVTEASELTRRSEALIRLDIRMRTLKAVAISSKGKGTYLIPSNEFNRYQDYLAAKAARRKSK